MDEQLHNVFVYTNESAKQITYNEAYAKKYKCVYFLCLDDDNTADGIDPNNQFLSRDVINKFVLIKAPLISIRHRDHGLLEVDTDVMKTYFQELTVPGDTMLVFPMFIIEKQNVQLYNLQFSGISNLQTVMKLAQMNRCMIAGAGASSRSHLSTDHLVRLDMIRGMMDSKFWVSPINCNQNINLQFNGRSFNVTEQDKEKHDKLREVLKMNEREYQFNFKKYDKFVDPSLSLAKQGYRLYRLPNNIENIDTKQFGQVLKYMLKQNVKEAYYFVMYTLVSKNYCHLVLHNMELLTSGNLKDLDGTFMEVFGIPFRYGMSYAWLCMYMEESIKKTHTLVDDRFIFTCDEACHFPAFPFDRYYTNTSPYLPILVDINVLNTRKNTMGVDINTTFHLKHPGVVDSREFRRRLNIFLTNKDIDMFEGMTWTNTHVTGSVMAAALPKFNPLMLYYSINSNDTVANMANFFNAFYKNADVDVMICEEGKNYIDRVYGIYDVIQNNVKKHFGDDKTVHLTYKKTVTIVVNKEMELEEAYSKYLEYMCNQIHEDAKYASLRHVVEKDEIKLMVREKNEKPFLIFNNIKYRLTSEVLPREIELFSVRLKPISVVIRFYLPIVRSFYDGNTVYMTPSCVSACMTLINIDYRYFAGTKDPIEVINKYRRRGFSILLNKQELVTFQNYSKAFEPWKTLYMMNPRLDFMPFFHAFFKPNDARQPNLVQAIPNWKDMFETNYMKYKPDAIGCDVLRRTLTEVAINDHGFTIPLKLETFDKFDFSILKKKENNNIQV